MSTKTEKFDLHQWEPTDNFLREEINENFAKLDTGALKVKVGSFVGTGKTGYEVDFGIKPKVLVLMNYQKPNSTPFLTLHILSEDLCFRMSSYTTTLTDGSDDPFIAFTETGIRFTATDFNLGNYAQRYVVFY